MKWFQHYTDTHENPKTKILIRKYGLEGYAICWILREIVGKYGANYRLSAGKDWKILTQEITRKDEKWLNVFYDFLAKHRFICPKAYAQGALYIPKMKEYSDNWTKKLQRSYEVTAEQVPSDKITLDKKRLDKIIELYVNLKNLDKVVKCNKNILSNIYKTQGAAIKDLLLTVQNDSAAEAVIRLIHREFTFKKLDWKMTTVIKHLPEYLEKVRQKTPDKINPEGQKKVKDIVEGVGK